MNIFNDGSNQSNNLCPHCKSNNTSMDKHEYFKCNVCNRSFDIPYNDSVKDEVKN